MLLDLITLIIIWWSVQVMKLLTVQSSPVCHFLHLRWHQQRNLYASPRIIWVHEVHSAISFNPDVSSL
jgi:hypothetical protein